MPRSILRPQTGHIVWYFAAAPPATAPIAALVVATVDRTHFNLVTFDPVAGTATFVGNVVFHYGTRPASGAWCTPMRVNEPLPGAWPSLNVEVEEYVTHDMNEEQREARREQLVEQMEKEAEAALEREEKEALEREEREAEHAKHAELENAEEKEEVLHGRGLPRGRRR
jgi:hypothetical protein